MDEIPVKWSHHKQNLGFVPIMIRMETQKAGVLRCFSMSIHKINIYRVLLFFLKVFAKRS